MVDLYDHVDYRSFLLSWMTEEKKVKPFLSYRYLGNRIGLDPGQLAKVLNGTRHLAEDSGLRLASYAGLKDQELEYFRELIRFTKAKTPSDIKRHFEQLQGLRVFRPDQVGENQVEFFSDWRLPALRALLSFHVFNGDWDALAKRITPPITAAEAMSAVARLERLGFLVKRPDGGWDIASPFLTTGSQWRGAAIRLFQLETLRLAQESVTHHPPAWRDISTLTISFPKSALPEIKAKLAETRESILRMIKDMGEADSAYQLNMQLFPLVLPSEEAE